MADTRSSSVLEFRRPAAPWQRASGVDAVLGNWRSDGKLYRHFALDERLPAKPAAVVDLPPDLSPQLANALRSRGLKQLYTHQAESYARVRNGEHIVIATPTASGKSLCYNLPVLDGFAREPDARALYLFPTKALARDQEIAIRELMTAANLGHGAITYDGDTPGDARRAARERSGVLITNPDMLHTGILPHHANWARLFANLKYIVIDELHTYRGVFGSHLANVLRRLQRVAAFHGGSPTVIFASATIGNPREHAERIVGQPVSLVDESGAPTGEKNVLVFNPPLLNAELGIRASYVKTAVRLAGDLVRANVPTIVFGQSRNTVEVMLKYLRDRLAHDGVDPETIHAYRGGYLPETRRAIEQGLREGEVRCVVATNALELGIDIGALDAVVCAGYPGSVAGLWQRFGRAGRRNGSSLALLVTSSAPLDQFFAADPQALIGAPIEHARIDPDNIEILVAHLKCASFELPFEEGEPFGDVPGEAVKDALDYLAQQRIVHPALAANGKTVYHWANDVYPANHTSLRSVSWDNFVIIDVASDHTIAEMDWRSTHTMLHEQAIYQHSGEQYQVERLDYDNHKAYVRKVAPDYYTDAMTYLRVSVLEDD
ncbi:MAG: DEAD/DEAH box helicase, partial [Clostridia bacterium]|nr:DEAD/DEAH box helicase [Deltaproteobacteria bacterium]